MERVTLTNSNSELILNLSQGGQIEKLALSKPNSEKQLSVILSFNKDERFFRSGNFLMFPWVNRLESNEIKISNTPITFQPLEFDSNNRPIHGLFFKAKRKLVEIKKNFAKIEPISINENFPSFTESYYLEETSLKIRTEFHNPTNKTQEFAYGYHPYLQLNTDLENCFIHTNCNDYIPLTAELIPNKDLEKKSVSDLLSPDNKIRNVKLDHLFTSLNKESYFGIVDIEENLILQIRISPNSQIPLPYFQVYTPEDRKSIAIEPMCATGNAFFIPNSGLCKLKPDETKFGEFFIELKEYNT